MAASACVQSFAFFHTVDKDAVPQGALAWSEDNELALLSRGAITIFVSGTRAPGRTGTLSVRA